MLIFGTLEKKYLYSHYYLLVWVNIFF